MRLIWTCENIDLFRPFCSFLESQGIQFTYEDKTNTDWSSDAYGTKKFLLWIHDEDMVEKASTLLEQYLKNPSAPEFHTSTTPFGGQKAVREPPPIRFLEKKLKISLREAEKPKTSRLKISVTSFLIILCTLLFLFDFTFKSKMEEEAAAQASEMQSTTPLRKQLLFDYPRSYETLDTLISMYGYQKVAHPLELPPSGRFLYTEYVKQPVWKGYYPLVLRHLQETSSSKMPLSTKPPFEKIRHGQVWRLFTPILLHNDILHLFFNMVWLLLLGSQIEAHVGPWRYLLFIMFSALLSNTAQYLVSGPNFIGFSGVVCAMALFIKTRQVKTPWEGYVMSSGTFALWHSYRLRALCSKLQKIPLFRLPSQTRPT
jgi:GlpG protein